MNKKGFQHTEFSYLFYVSYTPLKLEQIKVYAVPWMLRGDGLIRTVLSLFD